jgi:hypothetical protein
MKRPRNLQASASMIATSVLRYQGLCVRNMREAWAEDATDICAATLRGF